MIATARQPVPPPAASAPGPRLRILAAARDVVAESGWRDARIALIAHRAGVATGSVYRHFDSKAHLYAEVLAMVSEQEVAVIRAIADADGPAAQRLVDAIFAFARRALRGRRLAYALIAEPCDPEIDFARLRYRAALAEEIARLIRAGIDAGEFVDVDATLAAACLTGACMEALVGPLDPRLPQAAADRRAARGLAQSIAGLCARMVFRQPTARLSLVTRRLP